MGGELEIKRTGPNLAFPHLMPLVYVTDGEITVKYFEPDFDALTLEEVHRDFFRVKESAMIEGFGP